MTRDRRITWTWTNWTFGVWAYPKKSRTKACGVDIGPLEIVWSWGHKKLHPRSTDAVR